jgi:methylenetetrahydrofolate--tRNA-(uracil-5-)-methyltransferase
VVKSNKKTKNFCMEELIVIGGGLSGCEAAWQAASRGIHVTLFEMRPEKTTGAHQTGDLAELVCSNSLGSTMPDRASGLLETELQRLGSLVVDCALKSAIPAGSALAVDRRQFSKLVTDQITSHPNIRVVRKEVIEIPSGPVILASGPLTSPGLSQNIQNLTGQENIFFFDAIAPIVSSESIDMKIAFRASRYGRGDHIEGDYINCPFSLEEYERFVSALLTAQRIELKDFETEINQGVSAGASHFFEGCLPVEVMASRGPQALAFGPMRPVGLRDPRTGQRPYAVIQLRQENLVADSFNLVGFQTNLSYEEQKRVFRLIPGLEKAEFVRLGQMHRNTFIASPLFLNPTLQFKPRPGLFMAGQITGVEGYLGNVATGWLAGVNSVRYLSGRNLLELPPTTMSGALTHFIAQSDIASFQPMKANFGILPPLQTQGKNKRIRASIYSERALTDLDNFIKENL